jgi:hypothetical protein
MMFKLADDAKMQHQVGGSRLQMPLGQAVRSVSMQQPLIGQGSVQMQPQQVYGQSSHRKPQSRFRG